jgi:hypothetical protein
MGVIDPSEYLRRMAKEAKEAEAEEDLYDTESNSDTVIDDAFEDQDVVKQSGSLQHSPTDYGGYENEALDYSKDMFLDDTFKEIAVLLSRSRLTLNVQRKLMKIYCIAATKDGVLTWSNAYLLKQRQNEFKLQMLELKNTLIGTDADSLLFNDFDLVVEVLTSRLSIRAGRSFEGFERRAGISTYQISHNYDNEGGAATGANKSGLSKLGNNLFHFN